MGYNSLFKRDLFVENQFADFLQEHLYNQLPFTSYQRIEDIENQRDGIDVVVDFNGEKILIDEKSQLSSRYINKPTKTFALELSFKGKNNQIQEGWFLKKSKKTTHYLLCFIHKCNEVEMPLKDDFKQVEVILVSRKKIMEYFESFGLTIEKLQINDVWIRNKNKHGAVPDKKHNRPFYFYFSKNNLAEEPINIIVPKQIYINLSDYHKLINIK